MVAAVAERTVSMAYLTVDRVSKRYDARDASLLALDDVSLHIEHGSFVSLLGPSGCGKSTLLTIVGGFERPSSGQVILDGQRIDGPGADRGMVFQDYALFPWKTVAGNVMFGLELSGLGKAECRARAEQYIAMVGLAGFADRYPHQLSGGMRQRCALARSLANEPKVLLMDEPLSAIDALTRHALQEEIRRLCNSAETAGKTVLYVTHDIEEAVFLSDRVVMLAPRPGRVIGILDMPFGRERDESLRATPAYHAAVDEIWGRMRSYASI
jgi:NitT/TauT family transport system ATP-binding protein